MVKITKKTPEQKTVTETQTYQMKDHGKIVAESVTQNEVEVPAGLTEALNPSTAQGAAFCEVEVDASYTHNLGNYKSAKMGVALRVPCKHVEVDGVYDWTKAWIEKRISDLAGELIAQNPDA